MCLFIKLIKIIINLTKTKLKMDTKTTKYNPSGSTSPISTPTDDVATTNVKAAFEEGGEGDAACLRGGGYYGSDSDTAAEDDPQNSNDSEWTTSEDEDEGGYEDDDRDYGA